MIKLTFFCFFDYFIESSEEAMWQLNTALFLFLSLGLGNLKGSRTLKSDRSN